MEMCDIDLYNYVNTIGRTFLIREIVKLKKSHASRQGPWIIDSVKVDLLQIKGLRKRVIQIL